MLMINKKLILALFCVISSSAGAMTLKCHTTGFKESFPQFASASNEISFYDIDSRDSQNMRTSLPEARLPDVELANFGWHATFSTQSDISYDVQFGREKFERARRVRGVTLMAMLFVTKTVQGADQYSDFHLFCKSY